MFNNKIKENIALTISVGTIIAGAYYLNEVNENLEKSNLIQKQLVSQIDDLYGQIDKQVEVNKILENKLDDANKKTQELESKVKENTSDIKKLLATNLKKKSSTPTPSAPSTSKSAKGTPMTMTLTFYGEGAEENGGYAGIDAQGNKLVAGTVASNVHPIGTKFKINGQIYTVRDRGGASHFNNPNRLDVFVPRRPGESKDSYDRRISNYGKQTVTAHKL